MKTAKKTHAPVTLVKQQVMGPSLLTASTRMTTRSLQTFLETWQYKIASTKINIDWPLLTPLEVNEGSTTIAT